MISDKMVSSFLCLLPVALGYGAVVLNCLLYTCVIRVFMLICTFILTTCYLIGQHTFEFVLLFRGYSFSHMDLL